MRSRGDLIASMLSEKLFPLHPPAGIIDYGRRKGRSPCEMSVEPNSDLQLEIGYLLLIDVVGYSKLLVNEQVELLQELNQIVRSTPSFRMRGSKRQIDSAPNRRWDGVDFFPQSGRTGAMRFGNSRGIEGPVHIFNYAWAFTVARSIRSPM